MAKFDQGPQKEKKKSKNKKQKKPQCFTEKKNLNIEIFNTMKNYKI